MLRRFEPYALAILRMIAGFLFICHGTQKLFGWFSPHGPARLGSLLGAAGVIETVGGLLIIAGLFTAPVAFVLCGEMAFAYFTQHAVRGFWPINNGGEPAVLFCFVYLYLFTRGAGAWSLDGLLFRR